MYVRDHYSCRILKQSVSPPTRVQKPDYVILEICLSSSKLLLACIYRPPKAGFLQDFENDLCDVIIDYKFAIVAGDVNGHFGSLRPCDVLDRRHIDRTLDLCNLSLIPYGSTFHLSSHNAEVESWLDIIASNCEDKLIHYDKHRARGFSAHDMLLAVFSFRTPAFTPKRVSSRDMRKIDLAALRNDALNAPWEDIVVLQNVNDKVSRFNEILLGLYDKHAPVKGRSVSHRPKPWVTPNIVTAIDLRDRMYSRYRRTKDKQLLGQFKTLRNQVNQCIRNAKLRYAHSLFARQNSPRELWQNLKKLEVLNQTAAATQGPSP